jgi:hypothetical protein
MEARRDAIPERKHALCVRSVPKIRNATNDRSFMKYTSESVAFQCLVGICAIAGICGMVFVMGSSERGYKHKEPPAASPVESPRFIETKAIDGGVFGNNPVYLIRDTKTGQEWLRSFRYGFVQVSPSASTPLRCEAEVPR